jgi:hypothetical protein
MLINVGGGDPKTGSATGIHWHMNLDNDITFVASDERRQDIEWVRMKSGNGEATEYTSSDTTFSADQIQKASKRKMDCVDCHNRPTHIYLSPNRAVDASLSAKKLDAALPFIKRQAVDVLSKSYNTTEEALNNIATELNDYYKKEHAEIYQSKRDAVNRGVVEVQRIYSTYFFPEMKTDWTSHPNNVGHRDAQGCFRCHNGKFSTKEGIILSNDCRVCHTTLDQTVAGKTFVPEGGKFQHPVLLGDRNTFLCATCHKGNRAFQHPLNLGDISKFQCAECHKEKSIKLMLDSSNLK